MKKYDLVLEPDLPPVDYPMPDLPENEDLSPFIAVAEDLESGGWWLEEVCLELLVVCLGFLAECV